MSQTVIKSVWKSLLKKSETYCSLFVRRLRQIHFEPAGPWSREWWHFGGKFWSGTPFSKTFQTPLGRKLNFREHIIVHISWQCPFKHRQPRCRREQQVAFKHRQPNFSSQRLNSYFLWRPLLFDPSGTFLILRYFPEN